MRQILSFISVSSVVMLPTKRLVLDHFGMRVYQSLREKHLLLLDEALVKLILVLEGLLH